ncbi:GNAT family N-acetyltransferase [Roseococcus pinisoli]|uniref:GNAT family N-acetyltransferase n=1 Tax=Roseococcus pinisoli TaxID=2835040 RepID=A0ABS5QE10_9PROT|nr:GNAT family N-acetyltransferase [Roseococcus pinisoli]MBS7811708.1 GNAT family N-acetyltransferase [Roseococcus pinisoli]
MTLRIETVTGEAALSHVPAVARLRTEVFCEWPYLYRGEAEDEARYLRHYAEDEASAIILAWDGEVIVGAATAQPMTATHGPVRTAFEEAGRNPADYCYFGESVLQRRYRGQGAGVAFFAAREAHARHLELPFTTFCAVIREADDPRRPAGYAPLDAFWRKRGYAHHPELSCVFNWREIGAQQETPHRLSFWIKSL